MVHDALEKSKKDTQKLVKRVQARGESFTEKLHQKGMEVHYSPENDYLTITLGEPSPSVSLPTPEGIYLMVDPDSGELNAVEIPFFVEMYKSGRLQQDYWQLAFSWIVAGNTQAHVPPSWEDRADEAFRELVPA